MNRRFYRRGRWLPLLLILVMGLLAAPVYAATTDIHRVAATTNLNTIVYLPTTALQPLFQSRINQQIPSMSKSVIDGITGKLPKESQDWANRLANTLIQPSASINRITPQQEGLATSLSVSLYPGDPKPINATLLIKFSVQDSSTVQVSAQPMPGSPALVNGPLTTFKIPFGQLQSINTTANCGEAALALKLQMPVSLDAAPTPQANTAQKPAVAGNTTLRTLALSHILQIQEQPLSQHAAQDALNAYVEIPAASLSALGTGIGKMSISKTLTAQNIRIGTQVNNLLFTSDISLWQTGVALATAHTYIQPAAENGNLVMHVTKTDLTVLVFTFSSNSYNQQTEQLLNSKIGNALSGKFNVTATAFGGGTSLPCAANDSLLLTGTTTLNS